LLASKIPARVRGREMVSDLTALARKVARRVPWQRFPVAVTTYEEREVARMVREEVDEEQILGVQDRCAVLRVCFRSFGARSIDALCDEINALFDDSDAYVSLSTIHRAKGLEAERVFVVEANVLPLRWTAQGIDNLTARVQSHPEPMRYSANANNHDVFAVQRLSLPPRNHLARGLALLPF
jgi:ATP-dependent exoDNAse (exonuclease V) beta subunit